MMQSNEEGFEEWDAEFLDQLIQVEELALTSTAPNLNANTTSYDLHPLPQHPLNLVAVSAYGTINYSPPRELSQRPSSFRSSVVPSSKTVASYSASVPSVERRDEADKEFEIRRLKRELVHVSRQLSDLEQECVELTKERNRKNEQLRVVFSKNDENLDDGCGSKSEKLDRSFTLDHGANQHSPKKFIPNDKTRPQIDLTSYTSKAIGVQTDNTIYAPQLPSCETLFACHDLTNKLINIWGFPNDPQGRNLFSNLVMSCETDFRVLFGCMGNFPSNGTSLQSPVSDVHSPETAKVSNFYSMLTKINNGTVRPEGLFGPLLDLCVLDNVVIANRSLHVLHVFLRHLLCSGRNVKRRKNVTVEGLTRNDSWGYQAGDDLDVSREKLCHPSDSSHRVRHPDLENGRLNDDMCSVPSIEWHSLFKLMHQIVMKHTEQSVRVEAVSIINVILMRSDAFTERKKFDQTLIFETVIHLLKKEAGLRVQKLAVHFLFLILNCPSLMGTFGSGYKDDTTACGEDHSAEYSLTPENFGFILLGLVECLSCSGFGIQETKLRRNTIILLSFLASSGRPGFEILVNHKLCRDSTLLMHTLQLVVSEVDREAASSDPQEIVRERTLLIRESLILLNRLVSNPAYSAIVLRALTNSRDMANLTIDIAKRLSWKSQVSGHFDNMMKKIREIEIVDLAGVFKKRVFTYLGDIS